MSTETERCNSNKQPYYGNSVLGYKGSWSEKKNKKGVKKEP